MDNKINNLSNKKIDKLGKYLRENNEHIEKQYYDSFFEWRNLHSKPLNEIYSFIQKALKAHHKKFKYKSSFRLKKINSVILKLQNQEKMNLSRMCDIAGCRFIFKNPKELKKAKQEIHKNLKGDSIFELKSIKDYTEKPKKSGYRSLHFIIKKGNFSVEIQLRTEKQHSWATAVEIVDLFEKDTMKAGKPKNDNIYNFFKNASNQIYIKEYNQQQHKQALEEFNKLYKQSNIRNKLLKYSAAVNSIEEPLKNKKKQYIVVILKRFKYKKYKLFDKFDYSLKVETFDENKSAEAIMLYNDLEKNEGDNAVLIYSENVQELKNLYPNYYADAEYFLSEIDEIHSKNQTAYNYATQKCINFFKKVDNATALSEWHKYRKKIW